MSDQIKVFWIEPNGMERRWLRRYSLTGICTDVCNVSLKDCCTAKKLIGDVPKDTAWGKHAVSDWPSCCDQCGNQLDVTYEHQKFSRAVYVRPDTGETCTLNDAPVGACWNAPWYTERGGLGSGFNTGPDGRSLVVKLPDGHDWMIDSRCSNCTRKDDNAHYCWVRHGRPEDGDLHVDKQGDTCSAGAGSIQTKNWHGFLHNGFLHT